MFRNFKFIIAFLLLIFILSSCELEIKNNNFNSNLKPKLTDLQKDNLKGQVDKVTIKTSKGIILKATKYNADGFKTDINGNIVYPVKYEYNLKNFLIKETIVNSFPSYIHINSYLYFDNSLLSKKIEDSSGVIIRTTDCNIINNSLRCKIINNQTNKLLASYINNFDDNYLISNLSFIKYQDDGLLISYTANETYNFNNQILTQEVKDKEGNLTSKQIYEYNNNNQVIYQKITSYNGMETNTREAIIEYGINDFETKYTIKNNADVVSLIEYSNYVLDENGNWTSRHVNASSTSKYDEFREILYK